MSEEVKQEKTVEELLAELIQLRKLVTNFKALMISVSDHYDVILFKLDELSTAITKARDDARNVIKALDEREARNKQELPGIQRGGTG